MEIEIQERVYQFLNIIKNFTIKVFVDVADYNTCEQICLFSVWVIKLNN